MSSYAKLDKVDKKPKKKKKVSEMSNREAAQLAKERLYADRIAANQAAQRPASHGDFREDRYGTEVPGSATPVPEGYDTLADWVVGPAPVSATGGPPPGYPAVDPQSMPMAPLQGDEPQQELMGQEALWPGGRVAPAMIAGREAVPDAPGRAGAAAMSLERPRAPGEDLPPPAEEHLSKEAVQEAIAMLDQQIAALIAERERLLKGGG